MSAAGWQKLSQVLTEDISTQQIVDKVGNPRLNVVLVKHIR